MIASRALDLPALVATLQSPADSETRLSACETLLATSIAAELADRVVITSDNPRTEDPQRILDDVVAGVPSGIDHLVEGDRAIAIAQAIALAQPGDLVLIAGKGHEDYQIVGTEKLHFDDREEAEKALRRWN